MSDDPMAANDVLMKLVADAAEGKLGELPRYLELFPDHPTLVRREYATFVGEKTEPESAPVLVGRFELRRELGRGGQAIVHEAWDTELARPVALKVLSGRWGGAVASALRRFEREAELLARLDHPGICPVYEVGRDDGRVFIAMKLLAGAPLSQRLAERAPGFPALPPPGPERVRTVLPWLASVAEALEAAHRVGVVHRDVKPSNIVVPLAGDPVLLDFGIARAEDGGEVTKVGDVLGTPAYMAPEQILGGVVDHRADLHALGVTLFEAVTGERPFVGSTQDSLFRAVLSPARPAVARMPASLGRDLRAIVETALARDPEHRYGSAAAFAADLRAVTDGRPARVRSSTAVERSWRWVRRNPKASFTGAVLVSALLSFAVVGGALAARWPHWEEGRAQQRERRWEQGLARAYVELLEGRDAAAVGAFEALLGEGPRAEVVGGLAAALETTAGPPAVRRLLASHADLVAACPATNALEPGEAPRIGEEGSEVDLLLHAVHALRRRPGDRSRTDAFRLARSAVIRSPRPRLALDLVLARAAGESEDAAAVELAREVLRCRWTGEPLADAARAALGARPR